MQVVKQTPSQVSILDSTVGLKFIGGLILIGGIYFSSTIPSKSSDSLMCNRKVNFCQILRTDSITGAQNRFFSSDELKSANIISHYHADLNRRGRGYIDYDIVLSTKSYEQIVFIGANEREDLMGFTNEINNFIKNPSQPTLKLTDEKEHSFIKNTIFILACLIGFTIFFLDDVTYTFDKESKTVFIKRQGVRGTRITSLPSSNVSVDVEQKSTRNVQTGKVHYWYNLNLMAAGKKMTLTSSNREECYQVANDIQKML